VYEQNYSINVHGQVFSNFRGTFLKPLFTNNGYVRVRLFSYKGKSKYFTVHRLVAINYLPNPNNLPQVNHINGNRQDNRVDNLEWCTPSYNVKDGFNRGRVVHNKGKKYVNREKICEFCKNNFDYKKIQQRFCDLSCFGKYRESILKGNKG